jgi:hypothetical protein
LYKTQDFERRAKQQQD